MKEIQTESPKNRGDNTPTKHLVITSKTPSTRNKIHLVESLAERDTIDSSHIKLVSFHNLMVSFYYENTAYISPYTWRKWAGSQLKASPLLTWLTYIVLECTSYTTREKSKHQYHTHLWTLWSIIASNKFPARYTDSTAGQILYSNHPPLSRFNTHTMT